MFPFLTDFLKMYVYLFLRVPAYLNKGMITNRSVNMSVYSLGI